MDRTHHFYTSMFNNFLILRYFSLTFNNCVVAPSPFHSIKTSPMFDGEGSARSSHLVDCPTHYYVGINEQSPRTSLIAMQPIMIIVIYHVPRMEILFKWCHVPRNRRRAQSPTSRGLRKYRISMKYKFIHSLTRLIDRPSVSVGPPSTAKE